MSIKINYLIHIMLLLITISCECGNSSKNRDPKKEEPKKRTVWISAPDQDGEPLTGHIDILKFDGQTYSIPVAHIECDPDIALDSPEEEYFKEIDHSQDDPPLSYPVELESGKYKLIFYDQIQGYLYNKFLLLK